VELYIPIYLLGIHADKLRRKFVMSSVRYFSLRNMLVFLAQCDVRAISIHICGNSEDQGR
jgi:hypothetical protein